MVQTRAEYVPNRPIDEVLEAVTDHANDKRFNGFTDSQLLEPGERRIEGSGRAAATMVTQVSSDQVNPDYIDEFGFVGPLPASDGQRQPLDEGASTGPAVGMRLPDFTLPSAGGRTVSFHEDRGESKAAVVFFRSAVW